MIIFKEKNYKNNALRSLRKKTQMYVIFACIFAIRALNWRIWRWVERDYGRVRINKDTYL